MPRILFLVQGEQRLILDRLYESITAACDCDLRRLNKDEQRHLKRYFSNIDIKAYDVILMMTRAKYAMTQTRFLRNLPNLVFLEHDACQNYIKHSKYYKQFSRFYKALPHCKVISSGYQVTQKLRAEGINAHFVPKGYDQELITDLGQERDIELGFIGTLDNRVYRERHEFLTQLQATTQLRVMQTASGEAYANTLNRIRFFISADINFGEYMVKNFEAMAAGCVVFAFDQGTEENQALGFKDMGNLVLYRSQEELLTKLTQLHNDNALVEHICQSGKYLVQQHLSFHIIGNAVIRTLESMPIQAPIKFTWWPWR